MHRSYYSVICDDCQPSTLMEASLGKKTDNTQTEYISFNITIKKEFLAQTSTLILVFIIWVALVMRTFRKSLAKTKQVKTARKFLNIIFTVVNLVWIIACLFLIYESLARAFDPNVKEVHILSLYPWYLTAILSCCIIDMSEDFFMSAVERFRNKNGIEVPDCEYAALPSKAKEAGVYVI